MAKRIFDIEKTERFQAGMSTSIDIQLDDTGFGKAIVEWKRGEKKEFPVRKGQRLYVNMWGGFPDVQVWEQPKPPKDPIMRFLWEHGFQKKKVLSWNDPQFVSEKRKEWNAHEVEWLHSKEFGAIKVLFRQIEWKSSMTGNWRIGAVQKLAIAVRPGATLGEVQEGWEELKKFTGEIAVIPSPSWGI
ncbi:MAG TPA: hypothetical protein VIK74_10880 [Parasegetibacter sp.]